MSTSQHYLCFAIVEGIIVICLRSSDNMERSSDEMDSMSVRSCYILTYTRRVSSEYNWILNVLPSKAGDIDVDYNQQGTDQGTLRDSKRDGLGVRC